MEFLEQGFAGKMFGKQGRVFSQHGEVGGRGGFFGPDPETNSDTNF